MDFSTPRIMGVLNVTPDSFSDGGQYANTEEALVRVRQMIADGADLIDVGGESTGPGSPDVSAEEELLRVAPVIDLIASAGLMREAVFSIDTYKAAVAEYALARGFTMVNDVTALRGDAGMKEVLLRRQPYAILMYSKDPSPRTTRDERHYADVVATITAFLRERAQQLIDAGFPREKILIDPGMGLFVSADPKYSFELIERLDECAALGFPVAVGISRKSFLGGVITERDPLSVQLSLRAIQKGASVVRVHNTALMAQSLRDAGLKP